MQTLLTVLIEISRVLFLLIALYVLLRSLDASAAELAFKRAIRRSGPGRFMGVLEVIDARHSEFIGERYGLKWENEIGSARRCDIRISDPKVQKKHAIVFFQGTQAFVAPMGKARVYVESRPVSGRTELHDGDSLQVGEVLMVVTLL